MHKSLLNLRGGEEFGLFCKGLGVFMIPGGLSCSRVQGEWCVLFHSSQ